MESSPIADNNERKRELVERSQVNFAFVEGKGKEREIESWRRRARESLLNPEGTPMPPVAELSHDIRTQLDQISVLLPVYNQHRTIGKTIEYLVEQLGLPPERVSAASCSNDGSDEIMREKGIEVVDQRRAIQDLVDVPRLLDLTAADSLDDLRGKGLTMFVGHLHRLMNGKGIGEDFVFQVDTDIENIGTAEGEWNPLGYFAREIAKQPSIDVLKASKNGRNNQPMHIFLNTWPLYGEHGRDLQTELGTERWLLTGEFGWRDHATQHLRWSTGYPIEMTLNVSQAELGLQRAFVNIPEPRTDGMNLMTKETIMYSDIQRVILSILLTRKRLHDLTLSEIAELNRRLDGHLTFMCFEQDENPGPDAMPNDVTQIKASKILPDIETLQKEGIIYSGK